METSCGVCGDQVDGCPACDPDYTPSPRPTYEELVDNLKFAVKALRDAGYRNSAATIDSILIRCRQGGESNNG